MTDVYQPIAWPEDSTLTAEERATVEVQRRGLWDEGVRREPLLTEMAFSFAAVLRSFRGASAMPCHPNQSAQGRRARR